MFKIIASSMLGIVLSMGFLADAQAHGVWVGVRCDKPVVVLGEGPGDNAYSPSYVTQVRGFTVDHKAVPVETIPTADNVQLGLTEGTAIVVVDFDYGIWSKGSDGVTQNKPMNEVPGAKAGTRAIKYNVSYLNPDARPLVLDDLAIQLIPSVNPATLNMGDQLEILVLHNGKPMVDTPVIVDVINDLDKEVKTDKDGKVTITVRNNALNVVGVEIGFPEKDNPQYTQTKYFSSMSFTCYPEAD